MLYYNHVLLYSVNDDTDRSICSQYKYCTSVVADLSTCSHLQIHVLYKSCCWLVYLCVVMYRYMYWIRVVADLSICSQYRYCASVVADLSISILYNSFCPILPHGWVNIEPPLSLTQPDDQGTDDDDHRPQGIPQNVQEHTPHVQLGTRSCQNQRKIDCEWSCKVTVNQGAYLL